MRLIVTIFFDNKTCYLVDLQIMWLVDTFRSRIVDISEHFLTIEVKIGVILLFLFISYIIYTLSKQ